MTPMPADPPTPDPQGWWRVAITWQDAADPPLVFVQKESRYARLHKAWVDTPPAERTGIAVTVTGKTDETLEHDLYSDFDLGTVKRITASVLPDAKPRRKAVAVKAAP